MNSAEETDIAKLIVSGADCASFWRSDTDSAAENTSIRDFHLANEPYGEHDGLDEFVLENSSLHFSIETLFPKRSWQEMEFTEGQPLPKTASFTEDELLTEDFFDPFDDIEEFFPKKKAALQTVVTFYQRWLEIFEIPEFSGRIMKLPEAFSSYFPGYIALSSNGIMLTQQALVRCVRGDVEMQRFDVARAKEERKHLKKVLPAESLSKLEKVTRVLRLFDWVATCLLYMQSSPKYDNLEKFSAVYPEFDRLCPAQRLKLMDFANLLFSSVELFKCASSHRCHKCIQLDAVTVITEGSLHSRGGDPTEFTILRDLIQQRESEMYFSAAASQPRKRKEGNAAVQRYVTKKAEAK